VQEGSIMTGEHTPSHHHARTRAPRRSRLVSLFRGHHDTPEAPAKDPAVQDLNDETDAIVAAAGRRRTLQTLESEQWWGQTEMDWPPAHHRPYVQDAPAVAPVRVLNIHSDIRDLPLLRDTIRAATQRGCTQCGTCGRPLRGATWAERFAAQLAHLGSGEDVPSSGAGAAGPPDFALHRYDGLVDEIVAGAAAVEEAAGRAAADAFAACQEYAGRHTTGSEAA
jgi:hypothetical protein